MSTAAKQYQILVRVLLTLVYLLTASMAWAQPEISVDPLDVIPGNKPTVVKLPLNTVHVIDFDRNVREVIVANPEIADVIVKTQTKAYTAFQN